MGKSKGTDLPMLLRMEWQRARLLLSLILVEKLLRAAVVVTDVVSCVEFVVLVRWALRVVVAVVALAVGVPVVELVVTGVELVDVVVVWGDEVSDESSAVMLHFVRLSARRSLPLLLTIRLRARRGERNRDVTSTTSVP